MKPRINWQRVWIDHFNATAFSLPAIDRALIKEFVELELKRAKVKRKKPKVRKRLKKSK